jgi:DNA-directed RNA polymerase subunit beta'
MSSAATAAAEIGNYDRINDYGAVRISLASPHDIRSWSFGEVKKPETINYRTYRPEKDGLFCERIFGPEKDWECTCGKYRGMKYKGMICDRCGVKVTHSRVRRKRMGHIELAAPVVHIWFFKAMPSRLGTLLDMKTTSLEKIIYFQDYVVIDPGETPLKERQLLTEDEYRHYRDRATATLRSGHGAPRRQEAAGKAQPGRRVRDLRERLDKEMLAGEKASKQRIKELVKRLKTVEALRDSDNKCEWMVLECIPVIPPDLRPARAAGQRQLRHQRPERPVPPHHQPQQPAQEAGRPERARRSSSATRSGCCSSPSTRCSTTTGASGRCSGAATAR